MNISAEVKKWASIVGAVMVIGGAGVTWYTHFAKAADLVALEQRTDVKLEALEKRSELRDLRHYKRELTGQMYDLKIQMRETPNDELARADYVQVKEDIQMVGALIIEIQRGRP